MKEIFVPADILREGRPSFLWTLLKSTATAVVLSVISFFILNVCGIFALGVTAAVRHRPIDLSLAYRNFAAPAALAIFAILWVSCLVFFFRERARECR
jgi:hypothetical protein